MTTETEQLLDLAQATEAAARVEAETWQKTYRDLDTRNKAITGELATIAEQLRAGRMAELTGEKVPGLAALAAKQRDLETEQTELVARLEITSAEQARTNAIFHSAAEALAMARIAVGCEKSVARAGELDRLIDGAYAALIELLNERGEIAEGAAQMNRLGIAGAGAIPFDWRQLPHGGLRPRLGFPGTW